VNPILAHNLQAGCQEETMTSEKLPVDHQWLEDVIVSEYGRTGKLEATNCTPIGERTGFLSYTTKVDLTWSGKGGAEFCIAQ
jgi:hypothetical protein